MEKKDFEKNNLAGGSATGGGINFQAAVSAVVYTHILDGSTLGWLEGILNDTPVSIAAETGGAGDDISLIFTDGSSAEVQVKKGLTATKRLWEPLIALAQAINTKRISYGLLIVCPECSNSIRHDLANDIVRLGDGRNDNLKNITTKFIEMMGEAALPHQEVCQRLRIVVLNALPSDTSSIGLAKTKLASICGEHDMANHAWSHLYKDATKLIQLRGKRDAASLLTILKSNSIKISSSLPNSSPVGLLSKVKDWSHSAYRHYTIFGVEQPLSIDDSWIPIKTIVKKSRDEVEDIEDALKAYHAWGDRTSDRDAIDIDPATVGLYFRHCVISAGPGMGKTTLLKKLFRVYNSRYQPAIIARLPTIVARMNQAGSSFEESLFNIGLDGSGISYQDVSKSNFKYWTLLLDGLDECGQNQESICQSVLNFLSGFPFTRVIITTRPVGYRTTLLKEWRHYEMLPLEQYQARNNIYQLLSDIFENDKESLEPILSFLDAELDRNKYSSVIKRSPLLMGLTVSLAIKKIGLGKTKTELYKHLIKLIEDSNTERKVGSEITSVILTFFFNCLGWNLIKKPTEDIHFILDMVAASLSNELDISILKAKDLSEQGLSYWEEKGVVERVQHAGLSLLTFIHKTFLEFAAGRYLAILDEDSLTHEIDSLETNISIEEVLVFAGSLGAVSTISNILLKKYHSAGRKEETLVLLLDIAAASEVPLESKVREEIFKHASMMIASLDKKIVYRFSSKLLLACEKYPYEVSKYTNKYIEHENYWTKISCIALSLASNTYERDITDLVESFTEFFDSKKDQGFSSLSGNFPLFDDAWIDVRDAFVLTTVKKILKSCEETKLEELFSYTIFNNGNLGMSLLADLAQAFKDSGYPEFCKKLYKLNSDLLGSLHSPKAKKREIEAHRRMCSLLIEPELATNDTKQLPLLELSAFLSSSNYWHTVYSDAIDWPDESFNSAVREVFRGLTLASGIPSDGLQGDANTLLRNLSSTDEYSSITLFDSTTNIDIEPSFETIKEGDLNSVLVESAMYCEVQWIVIIAGNILVNTLDKVRLAASIQRLLKSGSYNTLLVTAHMLSYLEDEQLSRSLLIDRLSQNLIAGCQFLYSALSEVITELDDEVMLIVERGLLESGPRTATEAANLAAKYSEVGKDNLHKLLLNAFKFWVKNEEPYPIGGGTIPDSPREEILSAIIKIKSPNADELIGYLGDARSDVAGVAKEELLKKLESDTSLCDQFIRSVSTQLVEPKYLSLAINKNIQFDTRQLSAICEMLEHHDPKVRSSAFNILKSDFMPAQLRLEWLDVARNDSAAEIREEAELLHSKLNPSNYLSN